MENRFGLEGAFCIVCAEEDCNDIRCQERIDEINPEIIRKTMEEQIYEIWGE